MVGFQKGDVVMSLNGEKIATTRDLERPRPAALSLEAHDQ